MSIERGRRAWRAGLLALLCGASLAGCQLPNSVRSPDAKTQAAAAKQNEDDDVFARRNESTPADLKRPASGGNAPSEPMMSSLPSLPSLSSLGSRPCRT